MSAMRPQLKEEIVALDQIPPLSGTASELLRAAADPDLDVPRLISILERDPALTARVVGLANSAFFGKSQSLQGLQDAIIRVLGFNMVRSLALSMALANSFDTSRCPAYDLRHYWLMALGTASLARDLARALGQPAIIHPDAAYLGGLLHNIGELALVHLRPDLMCEAVHAQREVPGSDLIVLQREFLGIDCWQAGEVLAFYWHLPDTVQQVIAHYAATQPAGTQQDLVQVVVAARAWVKAALSGELPDITPPDAAAAEFQRIVASFRGRLDELQQLAAMMV